MSIDKLVDTHFESSQLVNTQLTYWTLLLWKLLLSSMTIVLTN